MKLIGVISPLSNRRVAQAANQHFLFRIQMFQKDKLIKLAIADESETKSNFRQLTQTVFKYNSMNKWSTTRIRVVNATIELNIWFK